MTSHSSRKTRVADALLHSVTALLEETTASQKASVEGATHEESRAENDKDTRGLETTYLARGLAKRVVELRQAKSAILTMQMAPSTRAEVGALVTVEDDDDEELRTFFLAPAGGGMTVDVDGPVSIITPQSPLARGLVGREVGDDVVLKTPKGKSEVTIIAIE